MYNKYFDNGATSFPKPKSVAQAVSQYLNETGGSYGRSFHGRSIKSSSVVENCRNLLADKFNVKVPENIIFTPNATEALNLVIRGLNLKGAEVLISPLEHNSVVRPLHLLEKMGLITVRLLPHESDGMIKVNEILTGPDTKLVIVNNVSNVNGVIQPISDIKSKIGHIPILVDGAQSAGHIGINLDEDLIDYYAFTGHKGLLGPTGTGGVYIKDPESIEPLIYGGTGSSTDSHDMPEHMPEKFEAGTPNVAGIYGLEAALKELIPNGYYDEKFNYLLRELKSSENLALYTADDPEHRSHLFSFTPVGGSVSETASRLYHDFGIETRSGLHCSPLAHKTLGTFPEGTIRISLSPFHNNFDLDYLIESILKTVSK